MHQWDRLIWWSGQNSAAIQALSAIAIVGLTAVLGGITFYYARLTGRMARTMERQMEFSFQPNVSTTITFRAIGEGVTAGIRHDDVIHAFATVENKSAVPIKLVSLTMAVSFQNQTRPDASDVREVKNVVLPPGGKRDFRLNASVPPDASREEFTRRFVLKCTDLTGISKHTFMSSDGDSDVTHYLGFTDAVV